MREDKIWQKFGNKYCNCAMRWLPKWVMLVGALHRRHENGRWAEMEETIKDEAVVGFQTGRISTHAPTRSGPISTLVAALQFLVHPRTRRKAAVEASAETERTRRPERYLEASRSPFEAGITGGFSLFMDNSNIRKRR
jgi:hypothetical protein